MKTEVYAVLYDTNPAVAVGNTTKKTIILGELDSYEKDGRIRNAIVADMFGYNANFDFKKGDIVAANIATSIREYQGKYYNDVEVRRIVKI